MPISSSKNTVWIWDTVTSRGKGLQFNAEAPQVCAQDYLQALAEGDISGHTPFEKYGRVGSVVAGAQDVWDVGGTYVFPTVPVKLDVKSSSSLDVSTGAKVVTIEGLSPAATVRTESVTMAGATIVTTSASFYRVNRMWVTSAGAVGAAVGAIDAQKTGTATIISRIAVGLTQSRQTIYTVPASKTLYLTSMRVSSGVGNTAAAAKNNFVISTLRSKTNPYDGSLASFFYPHAEIGTLNSSIVVPFEMPIKCPAESDVKVTAVGDTAQAVTVTVALRGWIE